MSAFPDGPPVTLMSLMEMPPVGGFTAEAVCRVLLARAGDNSPPPPKTPQDWDEFVQREAWPRFMESVNRRNLVPRGQWWAVVDDGPDWRRHISPEVQEQVDRDGANHVDFEVLGVALLVDSEDVKPVSRSVARRLAHQQKRR